jgi:hypothetical protein
MKSATKRLRGVRNIFRAADLLHFALGQHGDAVGHGQRFFLVVGDEDEGDAGLGLNRFQLFAHGLAQLQIERGKGFVEQQYFRVRCQGAGEGDALLLATGQLRRLAIGEASHLHQREHLQHALGDLRFVQHLAHRLRFEAEGQVLGDGHVREQRNAGTPVDRALERRAVGDVFAVQQDLAFGRKLEAGDHPQQGGLAAAGRAEQGEEFVVADVQIDVFQRHRTGVGSP